MSTYPEFGELDNATLGALILELASQLHIERAHRLALESALAADGILDRASIETAGKNPALRQQACEQTDLSIRKLLRVLSESKDPRTPLRAEARID